MCGCVGVRLCVHAIHVHKTSLHCCCCCCDVVIKQQRQWNDEEESGYETDEDVSGDGEGGVQWHDAEDVDVAEMGSVNQVLMSVVQGVVEVQDPPSQRCCFCILKKLTEAWGETGSLLC